MKNRKFVAMMVGGALLCQLLTGCALMASMDGGASDDAAADDANAVADMLDDTKWTASDASQISFDADGAFHWYQNPDVTDDNYFAGTYEVRYGMDEVIAYMETVIGVNKDTMQQVIDSTEDYTEENMICITLNHEEYMLNGEEQLSEPYINQYFGFLLADGTYLDIANVDTGTYYGFTKE